MAKHETARTEVPSEAEINEAPSVDRSEAVQWVAPSVLEGADKMLPAELEAIADGVPIQPAPGTDVEASGARSPSPADPQQQGPGKR